MDANSLLGLLLIGIGLAIFVRELAYLRTASIVSGRVVYIDRFDSKEMGEGEMPMRMSFPVVEFVDDAGERKRIVDVFPFGSRRGNVRVAFVPGRPEKARIYSFTRFWGLPVLLVALGVAALVAANV